MYHVNGDIYDPVSFFSEGGGEAKKGLNSISTTYGGWCARAMVVGQQVPINPELFTVADRRIYFFVNKRAKRYFDRKVEENAAKADKEWERISGEKPRL